MGLAFEHICGTTYHGRHGEIANAFRYRVDYVLCDLETTQRAPALFSRNRRNLTSLYDSDHGGARNAGRGEVWVRETLDKHGFADLATGRIQLLAQPRVFGHVFNPVSFWLIYDGKNSLRLVIAEVNNTYGERHSYFCHNDDMSEIKPTDRLDARKSFHVSPFQTVAGSYRFRFDVTSKRIGIVIDYKSEAGGVMATFHGARKPLTNYSILKSLILRPFGSRRVLGLIHWQALKLWLKGAIYNAPPPPPSKEVSR